MNQRIIIKSLFAKIIGITLIVFSINTSLSYGQVTSKSDLSPISIDTKNLLVTVDVVNCRWSAIIKGTEMRMNDIYFLPGNEASGWNVVSSFNNDDSGNLGSFETVTLHGTKPGQLDFDYHISVSKINNDIIVSMDLTNKTGKPVDVDDIDYFISRDTRLGGTNDKWISLGTYSQFSDYYQLFPVINLIVPKTYHVNHVIKSSVTGNSLLMGHVTAFKGASRFDVRSGWQGKIPDRMQVKGYCSYKVTVPDGKGITGEKLLICFSTDALRAMEHQGDLIGIAHDVRLKERKPIDLNDYDLVTGNYSRFHGWMSGGNNTFAKNFFQDNGLFDYYWGLDGGVVPWATLGIYGLGARRSNNNYPAEYYLPVNTVAYGQSKVLDYSNPKVVKLERDRAFQWVSSNENMTGRAEIDFAKWWDAWPGQFDSFMSGLETYRAATMPWREATDQKAPRRIIRTNNGPIDHTYGIADVCRISEDADRGYENRGSLTKTGDEFTGLFTEALLGGSNRFFYNGRVYWNDCDGFHIYKWASNGNMAIDKGDFSYNQGKVDACFHAIAGNTVYLSEALNVPYPEDRIELLKRISPPTMDVSYPVDLFIRRPAQVWNMPVERPFGKWSVLSVFNYSALTDRKFTATLDAAKDLRLDSTKEYIVYEFWSKQLVGTFRGKFISRAINPCDCEIYSIVEKLSRPVLISTSRHIRQMAVDIRDLTYNDKLKMLKGTSRTVKGDPYQLRFFVPEGFDVNRVELTEGLIATTQTDGNLLTVDYNSQTGKDVEWKVFFKAKK